MELTATITSSNQRDKQFDFGDTRLDNANMNAEERKKIVKHKLIDKGLSFRAWCEKMDVSRSLAKDLVSGRLDASRSERARNVKRILMEEFGAEIFD